VYVVTTKLARTLLLGGARPHSPIHPDRPAPSDEQDDGSGRAAPGTSVVAPAPARKVTLPGVADVRRLIALVNKTIGARIRGDAVMIAILPRRPAGSARRRSTRSAHVVRAARVAGGSPLSVAVVVVLSHTPEVELINGVADEI
jgi:hypothetical protein